MPKTMRHVKTDALCDRCRYGFRHNCSIVPESGNHCAECPMYDPDAPDRGWRNVASCYCLTVRTGEICDRFEEIP